MPREILARRIKKKTEIATLLAVNRPFRRAHKKLKENISLATRDIHLARRGDQLEL